MIGKNITYYKTKGLWWFRIYGYGLHYKNIKHYPELFSERMCIKKKIKLGRYRFGILKKDKMQLITDLRHYGKTEEFRQYYDMEEK